MHIKHKGFRRFWLVLCKKFTPLHMLNDIVPFVPTFLNYPKIYKGDVLNEGFGVELFDLIEKSKINYWIFGHHHQNIDEFTIGKTKLLTNQLGYLSCNEHELFRSDAIFQI